VSLSIDLADGWLWLPRSLVGQTFTQATRRHFLPLLTSPTWCAHSIRELASYRATDPCTGAEMTRDLRCLFALDADFNERTFRKQLALVKGQGYAIVESLHEQGDGASRGVLASLCSF
jgi:hypothetical protein